MCEAKTGGGEGAPTTCYTISIDYVVLRYSRNKGCFCTFGAVSVMAPVGLWGRKWSSLLAFGEKRRKTEVSTPLLYNRAERVWKGRRFGGRNESEDRQSSGSALPIRQVVQHRSVSGDVECLAGRKIHLIRCGNYYDFLLFLHQIFTLYGYGSTWFKSRRTIKKY